MRVSRVEIKRRSKVPKILFLFDTKTKKSQIDLGGKICTGSQNLNWFTKFCTKGKN